MNEQDQTPQEKHLDELRIMAGQNMDSEWDKLTGAEPTVEEPLKEGWDIPWIDPMAELNTPAVEEPVGRDLSWLNPIALLRSVFGSQKD